jgi:UDP-2-acetamido-3-amino-2,3-dideoxy-glucuronate N-acetyltransferase
VLAPVDRAPGGLAERRGGVTSFRNTRGLRGRPTRAQRVLRRREVNPAPNYFAHASACIDQPCSIGEGTAIWHFCHVMTGASIGKHCVLGQNVHVATGAVLGNGVRVQNNVSIYAGTLVEDDVFLGPSCVLTNVGNPRAEIDRRQAVERTVIRRGATIGANATIVCGVTVGRYAFIGAGAVVVEDVSDYALVLGVPGRHVAWMSRHAHRLPDPDQSGVRICPESGLRYKEVEAALHCLDLDEDAPLPGVRRAP